MCGAEESAEKSHQSGVQMQTDANTWRGKKILRNYSQALSLCRIDK